MYQHGGEPWTRWNAAVRDQIVRRQRVSGHQAGSWDPDDSIYGARGGRIYCTALATLTLEVYYRYLRLYDEPRLPVVLRLRPVRGDPPPPRPVRAPERSERRPTDDPGSLARSRSVFRRARRADHLRSEGHTADPTKQGVRDAQHVHRLKSDPFQEGIRSGSD